MTFQPVGGDTGSEHDRDNERPKRVTRDAFAPLRCKRRERRQGPFSQFGRVGGSQRRSDPQGSRWEVPATIISCKVNTEVRIRNVTTPSAQPACPSADIPSQAHARALRFYRSLVCFTSSLRLNRSPMKDIYCPTAARQPGPVIRNMSLHL